MDAFFFDKELSARQEHRIARQDELRKQEGSDSFTWRPEEIGWLEILNYSVRTYTSSTLWLGFSRSRDGMEVLVERDLS